MIRSTIRHLDSMPNSALPQSPELSEAATETGTATEFDLHGIVGIRMENASLQDVHTVSGQLGLSPQPLRRPADIVLQMQPKNWCPSPMRLLGRDDAGFDEHGFYLLRGKHKSKCCLRIPLEHLGRPLEAGPLTLDCQSGVTAVPMLVAIVNATAVARGFLPLHAAAFRFEGQGVLVTGWSKGGKTESLLGFMQRGAEYVGDEWVYLAHDGQQMWGIPEPITVWDWHLQQLPEMRRRTGWKRRVRLAGWKFLDRSLDHARQLGERLGPPSLARSIPRIQPLIQKQLHVNLPPKTAFGQAFHRGPLRPETLFFVMNHDSPHTLVAKMNACEIAQRMTHSLVEERMDLLSLYQQYRFAFPEKRNPWLERWEETQRQLLLRTLASLQTWSVAHPYPVNIHAMTEAMVQVLRKSSKDACP